jgi:effector-binding domain-containing protein
MSCRGCCYEIAEIEQQLQAEFRRVRKIESRLQSIRDAESNQQPTIIIKQIPDQVVLSLRRIVDDLRWGMELYGQLQATIPQNLRSGLFFCICHSDEFTDADLDMEVGLLVSASKDRSLALPNGLVLTRRELPGSPMMATTIVKGALETIHRGYAAITRWSGTNGYRLAGIPRDLLLQLPKNLSGDDLITEIQVPH